MTQQYDNELQGAIFKNDKKSESHPDYKGSVTVNGQEYWVNSWINTSKSGAKYMSLKLALKEAQPVTQGMYSNEAPAEDPALDDEIPF